MFHPAPRRVEYQEAKLQRPSLYKVLFDKPLPLESYVLGDTRISVSRQIDEVELSADPIKINQLRATRRGTGKRQLFIAYEAVQQAGLADVTPSQKCNLRKGFSRKLLRPRS